MQDFKAWSGKQHAAMQESNKITVPLYHYTNAAGLQGIIKCQQVWFTHYLHLNDSSELTYGMAIASKMLKEIGQRSDGRIKLFCDLVNDVFTHENVRNSLDFYCQL